MTAPGIEQRRSDRLAVTIPVRVEGVDPNGDTVEYEGRAQGLNRHGARVKLPWPLNCAYPVRVRTAQRAPKEAEFRLVSIGLKEAEEGEYGIECLDAEKNFWGIEFPSAEEKDEADARVLLQCARCGALAFFRMSVYEVEALRTIGMICKPCRTCAKEVPWQYANLAALEDRTNRMVSSKQPPDRDFQRVYMEVTVEVRDGHGNVEVTRTENLSKSGFCFTSKKMYSRGDMVMSVFPFDPITKRTELPARIARAQPIEDSERNFYGARFEAPPGSKNRMA